MNLPIKAIRTDGGTQSRAIIRSEVIEEYAEYLDDGEGHEMLPVIVFHDEDGKYWLADGFHRVAAYLKCKRKEIPVEVMTGSLRDAKLYAIGANHSHGLRRSIEDRREAVKMLLQDAEWCERSDSWIAEVAHVSTNFAIKVRKSLTTVQTNGSKVIPETPRRGKDGKLRRPPQPNTRGLCERCRRIGVPTCAACKENAEEQVQPGHSFNKHDWTTHFGHVVRGIDDLMRDHGAKSSPTDEGLRRLLSEFYAGFERFEKQLKGGRR